MSVETPGQVEQFLKLQSKDKSELQAICEPLGLPTTGTKSEIIDRLVALTEIRTQRDVTLPQAIPLRTRDENSQLIPGAAETFKQWRKLIFNTKGNLKEFSLLNGKSRQYKARLRYVMCSEKTLKVILEKRWYLPHSSQRDLIELLKAQPENFTLCIVQKPDSQGSSWLMLHCEPKAA